MSWRVLSDFHIRMYCSAEISGWHFPLEGRVKWGARKSVLLSHWQSHLCGGHSRCDRTPGSWHNFCSTSRSGEKSEKTPDTDKWRGMLCSSSFLLSCTEQLLRQKVSSELCEGNSVSAALSSMWEPRSMVCSPGRCLFCKLLTSGSKPISRWFCANIFLQNIRLPVWTRSLAGEEWGCWGLEKNLLWRRNSCGLSCGR